MLKNLGAIIALVFLLVSCAEDRPVEIAQASSHNLLEITDFQGKEFDLVTEEAKTEGSIFTNANSVSVEDSSKSINDFKLVSYKTEASLFEDVPFFGKENAQYKLRYEVTDKKLIIFKIASKESLPFQELTYAIKMDNGQYKVPMVGYPVTLFKLVRRENGNKELTHQLDKVAVYNLSEATHFDINYNAREDFDVVTKNNVFKANLFEGEWFYAATVVSASPEKANSIGRDVSMDFKARSVSRIKFVKRSNGLAGLNLNIDENIDVSDDINLQETINIPAEYFDYEIKKNGSKIELKEEKIGDDHPERRPFDQREYVELDFSQVISAMTKGRGGLDKTDAILESLEIAEGYMAFVVYHPSDEVRIRYAFRKAHTPLEGRIYFKDDRKLFGFFQTTKFAILNHRYEREDARQKLVKLNRFYPEDGKIVYYFSKTTPEHMKNAGRKAIQAWDVAFQQAGTGIRVVLDESKLVNLGDIRYNIINIVDTKDGARLLGYGPSIVDSESGEIISATSNIYANPFRESWIDTLRNYIRSKLGFFEKTNIGVNNPEKMTFYKSFVESVLEKANTPLPLKEDRVELLEELGFTPKSNIEFINEMKEDLLKKNLLNVASHNLEEGMFHFNSFDQNYKDAIEGIERTCGKELNEYIEELKSQGVTHNDRELEVLNKCADVLLEDSVISTLVHELGHNFGLRHNFIASTDTENFIYNEDGTTPSRSSSTMDYQPGNVNELVTPGPYDVAAIRFGYANKVLLANGEVADVNKDIPLKKQMEQKSQEIRKYKYCTDEDVERVTPLCKRHDDGTTPQEIVESIITNFNSTYTLYGNRYDRAWGPNSQGFSFSQFSRSFIPLKMIYDQWRYYFREFVGEREQYLHRFSKEEYKQKLEEMKNHPGKYGQYYREYFKASELAYNFLKEVIFTPAKTCVTRPANGVEDDIILLDFEELKETVFKNTGMTVTSCEASAIVPVLEERNLVYVGEFGKFFEAQNHTLDISDDDYKKSNTVGFKDLRRLAIATLTMRAPMMEHLMVKKFAPNFMDNPFYREEILTMAMDRTVNGIDATPYGFNNTKRSIFKAYFERESEIIKLLTIEAIRSINVPGNLEESDARKDPYSPNITSNPNIIPKTGVVTTRFRHLYIFAADTPEAPLLSAEKLIEKREELKKVISLFDAPKENYTVAHVNAIFGFTKDEGIIPSLEEMKAETYTLANVKQLVDGIAKHISDLQAATENQVAVKQGNFLSKVYTPILQGGAMAILGFVQNQENAQELMTYTIEKFLGEFGELLDQNGIPRDIFYLLAHENMTSRFQLTAQEINRDAQSAEALESFRPELEAQLDMITEILLSL